MDRKFDFRVLLVQIQNRLSNDDRRRFHFLVGDIIPRHQREDCTLGGTLTLLESLFDRALISEDYLDFLIRVFREIQCYDAVKRLQEYQSTRTPIKFIKPTFNEVLMDNDEDDKMHTQISAEDRVVAIDAQLSAKNEIVEAPADKPPTVESITLPDTSKVHKKKFFPKPITTCLCILLFVEVLALASYLTVHFYRKSSRGMDAAPIREDVYIIKQGKSSLANVSGQLFNHAENLSLTFADRLISIEASSHNDQLYSLKFIYTQNKSIVHRVRNQSRSQPVAVTSMKFHNPSITELTQCLKANHQSEYLVGLLARLPNDSETLFGSCYEQIQLRDAFTNTLFAYAIGKGDQYLKGFQFIWYKICKLRSEVISCLDNDFYNIPVDAFYSKFIHR